MKRHVRRFMTAFAVIFLSVSLHQAVWPVSASAPPSMPQGPELAAASWFLYDPITGLELASHSPDAKRSPASTTKIMTALVALEHASIDTRMTASQEAIHAVGGDYVRAGILAGETLSLESLLEMMLVTSANEAGYVIAENIAPDHTVAGFSALMNEKARELGIPASDSNFSNPCGMEEETHFSTARALALIAREAMKHEDFRRIIRMTGITAPDTNLRKSADWQISHLLPTNELVSNPGTYGSKYYTAIGVKTGYTALAGRCLVSAGINPDGLELIGVVLGAENPEVSFLESRRLLEFGFNNFARSDLKLSGEYYGRFDVVDAADNEKVTVNTLGSVSWLMPVDPALAAAITTESAILPQSFQAPVSKGQILGELQVAVNSTTIGAVKLVAENGVEKSTWADVRDRYLDFLKNPLLLLGLKMAGGLIVLLLVVRIILRAISRRRNRHKYTRARRNNHRIDYYRKR